MSFRLFIYYCALCGGWAAFLAWGLVQFAQIPALGSNLLKATAIGAILGAFVAAGVGWIDALSNSLGSERVIRVIVCAALGACGGAFGGLLGQIFYDFIYMPLFFGWMIAGVLIGASIGAYDYILARQSGEETRPAFRKIMNGVYGGLLGGLLGGIPFSFLIGNPRLPNSSLAISLVSLGFCIGLLVGFAQVLLSEAWIKVEEGFRAGRELLLTKSETIIGRAEGCDLGIFGDNTIAKTHAKITIQKKRYVITHIGDEGETYVNDQLVRAKPVVLRSGDAIRVGRCVLRFGERQKQK
jgi:hypothetical protein